MNGLGARSHVHAIALAAEDGEASLHVPDEGPGYAAIIDDAAPGSLPIETRRMDSFPELQDVDFIKIDVEGYEQQVWNGMAGILARNRPLIVILEFASARYVDPRGFLEQIAAAGFSFEIITYFEGIRPIDIPGLLALPKAEDHMIVLRR